MAVSTARQWRRRDSDSTHSVRRDHASSRESRTDMAVRLAEPPHLPLAAPVLMEKFVIDGGVPLRGTVTPAGNKNGALPILAASVLTAGEVFMDEPSVMATENAVMAAALTPGTTVIGNAACEPHVQDLARMLVKMGADIRGIGSNVLTITGRDQLGGCTHDVGPDHIEIGSLTPPPRGT